MPSPLRSPALLAVAVVLLAGCSPTDPSPVPSLESVAASTPPGTAAPTSSSPSPTPSPTPDTQLVVQPDWELEQTLLGDVVPAGKDAVVAYFTQNQYLYLGAWRASTGTELWRRPAGLGYAAIGVSLEPTVTDQAGIVVVSYLGPLDWRGYAPLEQVDAATGKLIRASPPFKPTSRTDECGSAACVDGYLGQDMGSWQLNATGALVPATTRFLPEGARMLGTDIYSTNRRPAGEGEDRGSERLGMVSGRKIVWERNYESVFGKTASSDHGWSWHDGDGWPKIGFGYPAPPEGTSSNSRTLPLGDGVLVALSPQDGAGIWSVAHALPCVDDQPATVMVTCLVPSGTMTYSKGAEPALSFADVVVSLAGLDPSTGAQLWSVPLDAANYGATFGEPFRSPAGGVVRLVNGAAATIDLTTGTVTPSATGDILACTVELPDVEIRRDAEGELAAPARPMGAVPCDRAGASLPAFSRSAVETAGLLVGGFRVVVTPEGLAGYEVG